ncbi:MAG: alpha,alpha-trehalose phosphorylase, partial [Gaiellaceae bacterium]|nr:alpha,alpha-trehalose phosphorylase [Gaiellaceae bacterium]
MTQSAFVVEPWSVRETQLDLEMLAQTESVFALANGHIGLRANLDEGEPYGLPGTYLNSFYELRPPPYAESGYGYPESGQTIVNVTNGKIIRLLVDDEPFDIRYGKLLSHERELDLRAGVLRRRVEWKSPAGAAVRVNSTRLVSFVQRSTAAILYEVEPLDGPLRLVVQSELVANEPGMLPQKDPRAAAVLEAPLRSESFFDRGERVVLVHSSNRSKLLMAAGMDHVVDAPDGMETAAESGPDVGR